MGVPFILAFLMAGLKEKKQTTKWIAPFLWLWDITQRL